MLPAGRPLPTDAPKVRSDAIEQSIRLPLEGAVRRLAEGRLKSERIGVSSPNVRRRSSLLAP